jgi:hypothetical protein
MPAGIDTGLWRGPYIVNRIAENPKGFATDGWGDSLLYNNETLTISSQRGMSYLQPDSWITRRLARNQNDLYNNTVQGLVLDAKGNPPAPSDTPFLRVSLAYPASFHWRSDTAFPITNGNFEFLPRVPIGNHTLSVRYVDIAMGETTLVEKTATVTPGGKNWVEVHLPVPFR